MLSWLPQESRHSVHIMLLSLFSPCHITLKGHKSNDRCHTDNSHKADSMNPTAACTGARPRQEPTVVARTRQDLSSQGSVVMFSGPRWLEMRVTRRGHEGSVTRLWVSVVWPGGETLKGFSIVPHDWSWNTKIELSLSCSVWLNPA